MGQFKKQEGYRQVECHPYFNQKNLKEFCYEKEIILTAYSPLGSSDNSWKMSDGPSLLENTIILDIAGKHGKSAAHVLIRYQIQRGIIVIPKSVTKHKIESNFYVWDFELDKDEFGPN
ncbi:aldo-keto reductase family 1 member B1-like [Daktulosphaira vitifoliae]|uniref:aldo-keto reductase family 1 member B1-like n=1 Tax=Daktulosphaira vitifoliae TaxID=58002 RepID=UPI0021A9A5C8|nr:aldo-keto reductase family 1 member B1-like [Daktulosphaira vitifoliae]